MYHIASYNYVPLSSTHVRAASFLNELYLLALPHPPPRVSPYCCSPPPMSTLNLPRLPHTTSPTATPPSSKPTQAGPPASFPDPPPPHTHKLEISSTPRVQAMLCSLSNPFNSPSPDPAGSFRVFLLNDSKQVCTYVFLAQQRLGSGF